VPHPWIQTIFVVFGGIFLWYLWRAIEPDRLLAVLIAGGFVARSLAGQHLFWVSWLNLPYGKPLQLGGGLWFFGYDARYYFTPAAQSVSGGLLEVVDLPAVLPSLAFTRILAVFIWLFGPVVSTALFVNLACYLGSAFLIVRWARLHDLSTRLTAVPLVALGYLPSFVLWSLQPLKDAFFVFFILLFAYSVDGCLVAWNAARDRRLGGLSRNLLLAFVALWQLAGTRWYYAATVIMVWAVVSVSILLQVRSPRQLVGRVAFILVTTFCFSQILLVASGTYLPPGLRARLRPWDAKATTAGLRTVGETIEASRNNFDYYDKKGAGTMIRAGRSLVSTEHAESTSGSPGKLPASGADSRKKQPSPAPPSQGSRHEVGNLPPRQVSESDGMAVATAGEIPKTLRGRLIAGFSALLLPRFVAERFQLISVGGGRGLWWLVEIDTLLFDAIFVIVVALIWRGLLRYQAWKDPFFWFVTLTTLLIATALAYTVSNYGTLLRHRSMVVATLVIAGSVAQRRSETGPSFVPILP
jgi:hypothetical protein